MFIKRKEETKCKSETSTIKLHADGSITAKPIELYSAAGC
jgi:hypothetical protein